MVSRYDIEWQPHQVSYRVVILYQRSLNLLKMGRITQNQPDGSRGFGPSLKEKLNIAISIASGLNLELYTSQKRRNIGLEVITQIFNLKLYNIKQQSESKYQKFSVDTVSIFSMEYIRGVFYIYVGCPESNLSSGKNKYVNTDKNYCTIVPQCLF